MPNTALHMAKAARLRCVAFGRGKRPDFRTESMTSVLLEVDHIWAKQGSKTERCGSDDLYIPALLHVTCTDDKATD